ncbi:MAG TPA: hypothetical protein VM888_05630 [Chitinophagaceae bacterium]|nr:hypothetical protein [Chitinophagaceae bacterium]
MLKLYVHKIVDEKENGLYAVETDSNRILQNLQLVYTNLYLDDLINKATQSKKSIVQTGSCGQFIFIVHFESNFKSAALHLFDCKNKKDNAAALYSKFSKEEWPARIKKEFIKTFGQLEKSYPELDDSIKLTTAPL